MIIEIRGLKKLWVDGFVIWPFIFIESKQFNRILRHEQIHFKQMNEMLVIPFYVLYVLNFIINLIRYKFNIKMAYYNISFEREAYRGQYMKNYLQKRERFSWVKLLL